VLQSTDLAVLQPHSRPCDDDRWAFELTNDGWRALALRDARQARLLPRQGTDLTASFPEVVAALVSMPQNTALDAELVVLDDLGRPDFGAMQRRGLTRSPLAVSRAAGHAPPP
jgi:bifunctional non-homologous end joining protein LigD